MQITQISLRNPAAVAAVVVLLALFGVMAIMSRPVQLLPVLTEPTISVFNNWRQAAPEEMESYIVEPQEQMLRRTPGVSQIDSQVSRGSGRISLTFEVGTDMQQALINVINNLNQAPPLPVDAGEPFVSIGGRNNQPNVATLQVYPAAENPNKDLFSDHYQQVIDNDVESRLSRIDGVSRVNMAGRRPFEIRVTFDPYRLAALGIPISAASAAIARSNDVSGGFADVGRRQYTVRFVGQFEVEKMGDLIIAWNGDRPVPLSEVATVEKRLSDPFGVSMRNGHPSYYISLEGAGDANTVSVLDQVNQAISDLNNGALGDVGLIMELSFDASVYIRRAISLVKNNLGLGILLAVGVLWFFLRSARATLIISLSIPVSLLLAFIALNVFGLSLNVISLAGLAFSVGLVLDASIIVQENILRLRQGGVNMVQAVVQGTSQVSGALFASTVTTIAIFLPILFLEGMEGQMFSDLALTLSVSVLASFLAALTIVPVATRYWMAKVTLDDPVGHWWSRVTDWIMKLTDTALSRTLWIVSLLTLSIGLVVVLKPKADFLPSARADAVQVFFNTPPGVNQAMFEDEIGAEIVRRLTPYMNHEKEPYLRGYNLSMFGTFSLAYIYPLKSEQTSMLLDEMQGVVMQGIPDTSSFASRASLLGIGFNGGRTISVDLQGPDIVGLMDAARAGMGVISELLPGSVVRPVPGLSLAEPELQIIPDERRITESGLNPSDVASAVRAMTGGLFVSEYFDGNQRYNVILRSGGWSNPDELAAMPIATPLAGAQTIGSLTRIERTVGPTSLQRFDGQRTVSLQVLPPPEMTVEEALDILRDQAGPAIAAQLPADASIRYRGSADRLEQALSNMASNFALAVVILFLLMAAIFRSLTDSLLVLLVMPLALAGGITALWALNLVSYQSLDMLTMIGFIILLGLVVNNAILLVSQTREGQAKGLDLSAAVKAAVLVRARPVYMSTLTSIFGMLPLMLIPGAGSDIYRGLATVIVGGMVVSALFTLILMPALLQVRWLNARSNSMPEFSTGTPTPQEMAR